MSPRKTRENVTLAAKSLGFPPLLWDKVYADFRDPQRYFLAAFDLVLSLYGIAPNGQAVADLREKIQGSIIGAD